MNIINIGDSQFKKMFDDESLFLPIRWDGVDFEDSLKKLFDHYIKQLEMIDEDKDSHRLLYMVKCVCGSLIKSVNHYLNGFPSKAYSSFENAMGVFMEAPLYAYDINGYREETLKLFRVVGVDENKPYSRSRVFHTPYNLRAKVSTSRYSIAGYPSLYLGSSLNLCCEEIHLNPYEKFGLASVFKLETTPEYTDTVLRIIELGIKPQDFLGSRTTNESRNRNIPISKLTNPEIKSSYLLWYPLIAACSFIRINKNDFFAAEYIIPQLLMQWARSESFSNNDMLDQLTGIRYFSCASKRASDMGFNYVFPTSGKPLPPKMEYCAVLSKVFRLTIPQFIHEYDSIWECERDLQHLKNFDYIYI